MALESDELKQKIQQSNLLSEAEKKEWLFLLPKMSDAQKYELIRILEIKISNPTKPTLEAQKPEPQPQAQKKEAAELDVGVYPSVIHPHTTPLQADVQVQSAPLRIPENAKITQKDSEIRAEVASYVKKEVMAEKGLSGQPPVVTDLTVEAMRRGSSIYEFFDSLAARFAVMVKNREKNPEDIIASFQESPLYRAYVEAGKQMLEGREPVAITKSEFEAIADFRSSLKKILYR